MRGARRALAWSLLALVACSAGPLGCASSGNTKKKAQRSGVYTHNSIHYNSFPGTYSYGGRFGY